MSKLILNGTNGITAYEADNTTVLSTKSLSELNTIKPIVFRSSSSLVISGKMTGDASLTPPVLRYSDENSTELVGVAFEHVATNTESFTEPDSTHTLPTGIQAGDLIVMLEQAIMSSPQGYGIDLKTPSGWTSGMGGINSWYRPSNYEAAYAFVIIKLLAHPIVEQVFLAFKMLLKVVEQYMGCELALFTGPHFLILVMFRLLRA